MSKLLATFDLISLDSLIILANLLTSLDSIIEDRNRVYFSIWIKKDYKELAYSLNEHVNY